MTDLPKITAFLPVPHLVSSSTSTSIWSSPTSTNNRYTPLPLLMQHTPCLTNDLYQNPQRHVQPQSNLPNSPTFGVPRNDPIIPANDSSWNPNISSCSMGGERAFHCYRNDHVLFHNTPSTQAEQPTRPSYPHSYGKSATDRANETNSMPCNPAYEQATNRAKQRNFMLSH